MTEIVNNTRYPIDERAERILTAGLGEFTQCGVRAARLSIIARKAGVSLATLRQYFPTREDLVREVIRSTIVRLIQQPHDPGSLTQGQPIHSRIRDFMRQFWGAMEDPEQAALLRLALGELSAFPELAVFYATEVIGRAIGRLEVILTEGVRNGEIYLVDVRTIARVIVSALITYGLWLASPDVHGELTGTDHQRARESAIEALIGLLGVRPRHALLRDSTPSAGEN